MSIGTILTLVAAIMGSGGLAAVVTAWVNSKRNKAQSETEARAQFASEFDVLAQNLFAEIKRQDDWITRLDETVAVQGEHIRKLQAQEWTLKRYIAKLIDRIRSLGGEPPEPPFDMNM